MRIGTANSYDNGLELLYRRQSAVASLQEQLGSGKKINRASDDPIGVAQAERAMVHLDRIETDQRALEVRRGAIASAESTLGEANALVQSVRDLVITAANGTYPASERGTVAIQVASLRDQLLALANRTDSNGVPLFGALGSSAAPFSDLATGIRFEGTPGQRSATDTQLPGAMNGQAVFMDVPSGNGTFEVSLASANTGSLWTDTGKVVVPSSLTGNNYSVNFTVAAGATTFSVVNTTTATTVASGQPYKDGGAIQFEGLAIVPRGTPHDGDSFTIAASTTTNIFKVIDDTIAGIDNQPNGGALSHAVALSLAQLDSSLDRLQAARSQAGDWLNRADSITSAQEGKTISLEADRSRAEDLDMVKGISDFNKAQTGYQAALQSYAQIQKLSLFNYIP